MPRIFAPIAPRPTAWTTRLARHALLCLAAVAALGAQMAHAQGFAAYISPPRFEVQGRPGQAVREVMDIQHTGTQAGRYRIYTNDWTFLPDNSVAFSDELIAGSCRPWVALERRELTLAPNAKFRFRFEITPPPDTPPRECRFAIMVEGLDPARVAQEGLNFPVSGRIAVVVYASIGGAEPRLEVAGTRVVTINGAQLPALDMRNAGQAHGRMDGFLIGTDADGKDLDIAPADTPILPGETRTVVLNPVAPDGKKAAAIRYPLLVKGTLEWGRNRLPLEQRFAP
jgi:hypothetical protein